MALPGASENEILKYESAHFTIAFVFSKVVLIKK